LYGLSAATGTPRGIIDQMSSALVAVFGDDAFIRSEINEWRPIVRASGATVD
jgi:hypothetical protein